MLWVTLLGLGGLLLPMSGWEQHCAFGWPREDFFAKLLATKSCASCFSYFMKLESYQKRREKIFIVPNYWNFLGSRFVMGELWGQGAYGVYKCKNAKKMPVSVQWEVFSLEKTTHFQMQHNTQPCVSLSSPCLVFGRVSARWEVVSSF